MTTRISVRATAAESAWIVGRARRALIAVCVLTFTGLWFGFLAQRPLYDPDEGRYAEIPREMLAGGDWVIPHLNGLAYLEKPPLQYWLTALTFRLLGTTEFAARLWTGLAGYGSLVVVFLLGCRLWGRRCGIRSLCLTAASPLFVLLAHQLTLDTLLSFWLLCGLACFLMAQAEDPPMLREPSRPARAWMLGCWAGMALAVLTKGLIGILIPGCTLIAYAIWQRDTGVLRRLNLRWGPLLFASIAVPWFVMAARANPAFLQFFFIREHVQRYLTSIENRSEPWWFFGPVLAVGILPWLPQALRSVRLLFQRRVRRPFDPERILWIWCVFVLLFFSVSNAKLIPYILPAVAPWALLCGRALPLPETRRDLLAGAALSLTSAVGIMMYTSGVFGTQHGRSLAMQLAPTLIWTAGLLAVAGLACLRLALRHQVDAALAALCAGWFLGAVTVLAAANGAQRYFSSKAAAAALLARGDASAPVFSVQTYAQSMTFYLRRTVVLVDYRDEFTLGLSQDPGRGLGSLAPFCDRWRSLNEGYALMPRHTWTALASQGLPMHEIGRFHGDLLVSRR